MLYSPAGGTEGLSPHYMGKYTVLQHMYDTMGLNPADMLRKGQRQVVFGNSRNRWENLGRMLQNMTKSRYLETKMPSLLIEQARLHRFWGLWEGKGKLTLAGNTPLGTPPPPPALPSPWKWGWREWGGK